MVGSQGRCGGDQGRGSWGSGVEVGGPGVGWGSRGGRGPGVVRWDGHLGVVGSRGD